MWVVGIAQKANAFLPVILPNEIGQRGLVGLVDHRSDDEQRDIEPFTEQVANGVSVRMAVLFLLLNADGDLSA